MGTITIDGRKVEFTDEKMSFLSSERQGLICLRCVIIRNCPHTEPAVCVRWRMTGEGRLRPVRKSQEMEW